MRLYGGFHSHGGTPIAGWFISWKLLLKWIMTRGTPMTMETPMLIQVFTDIHQLPHLSNSASASDHWGLGLWEVWLQQLCPAQWMLPLQCQEAGVRGAQKRKSWTGSTKAERKTQIWPVESWLYNRKLDRENCANCAKIQKIAVICSDLEQSMCACVFHVFHVVCFSDLDFLWFYWCKDCVGGEDQTDLSWQHAMGYSEKVRKAPRRQLSFKIQWFCVETWAFWRMWGPDIAVPCCNFPVAQECGEAIFQATRKLYPIWPEMSRTNIWVKYAHKGYGQCVSHSPGIGGSEHIRVLAVRG